MDIAGSAMRLLVALLWLLAKFVRRTAQCSRRWRKGAVVVGEEMTRLSFWSVADGRCSG